MVARRAERSPATRTRSPTCTASAGTPRRVSVTTSALSTSQITPPPSARTVKWAWGLRQNTLSTSPWISWTAPSANSIRE